MKVPPSILTRKSRLYSRRRNTRVRASRRSVEIDCVIVATRNGDHYQRTQALRRGKACRIAVRPRGCNGAADSDRDLCLWVAFQNRYRREKHWKADGAAGWLSAPCVCVGLGENGTVILSGALDIKAMTSACGALGLSRSGYPERLSKGRELVHSQGSAGVECAGSSLDIAHNRTYAPYGSLLP